ncbi:YlmH family RNA-binding protein [Bacillus sp. B-jedd]|uniref:YlmH family RNA-binding protein n=1 Tax=Bacillus sp. B-jedd TaxID=1476857 RepID=UPI0005156F69|nr:RNA-binding protein [Bacillus sp. B-jedd]CEG26748.1 RNA-binding S4 domain-containing protein [Bacillus sp. B-jedd]
MNIYQHFRPSEREFIDKVLQWKNQVETMYTPKLTDFLDPREQFILKALVGESGDIRMELSGGPSFAERKRALLLPDYAMSTPDDFQISLLEIHYPAKFVTVEHPHVLGSLMSLGLKRGKFGDILAAEGRIQFLCANEVSDFVKMNLESIGRASVTLKEASLDDVLHSDETWVEMPETVSSLRLDTVLAAIHNLSRQKSQLLITQGLVKVNWEEVDAPSFECGEGDMISARGYGRARLNSIEGKTKKDKWRIIAAKHK